MCNDQSESTSRQDQYQQRLAGTNADIIEGWRFCATLQLRTPLCALEHHGQIVMGAHAELPNYGPASAGIWVPVLKDPKQLAANAGTKVCDLPVSMAASDIGPIPADGGGYLPFLIAWKRIMESSEPAAALLAKLRQLRASKEHAAYTCMIGEWFEKELVLDSLVEECGVDVVVAERMYAAGLRDAEGVRQAPDAALLAVDGVDAPTLAKCRSSHGGLGPSRAERLAREAAEDQALDKLASACGVGGSVVQSLWDAGLRDPEAVSRTSDAQLLAIKGIGPKGLQRIRRSLAEHPSGR